MPDGTIETNLALTQYYSYGNKNSLKVCVSEGEVVMFFRTERKERIVHERSLNVLRALFVGPDGSVFAADTAFFCEQ